MQVKELGPELLKDCNKHGIMKFNRIPFPDPNDPKTAQQLLQLQSDYILNFSTLNKDDKEKAYAYERYEIEFQPEVFYEADGKTRTVNVMYGVAGKNFNEKAHTLEGMEIIRTANFLIPDSDLAEAMLMKHLNRFPIVSALGTLFEDIIPEEEMAAYEIIIVDENENQDLQYSGCQGEVIPIFSCYWFEWNGNLILECEMVIVRACPKDDEPDQEGEGGGNDNDGDDDEDIDNDSGSGNNHDPCDEFGNGDADNGGYTPPGSGDSGTGEGSPFSMPECGEDDEEPEPCETGDEIIDSDDIQQGMIEIWSNSNPDSDIQDRKEDGGFIIKNGEEYTFQRFPPGWPRMACGIGTPNFLFYNLPPNTVGWIHTNPYEVGEDIGSICYDDGRVAPYPGHASIADKQTTRDLVFNAMSKGFVSDFDQFKTIVIDKDGIRITNGGLSMEINLSEELINNNTTNLQPCAYQ